MALGRGPSWTARAPRRRRPRASSRARASCAARASTSSTAHRARAALSIPARARSEDGLLLRPAPAPRARRAARARAACARRVLVHWRVRDCRGARRGEGGRRGRRERARHRGGRRVRPLNGVADRVTFVKEDARRALADAKGAFDLVIADPPRLAPTRGSRDHALVAYSKLAENACRATRPGGIVVVCSCSAAVDLTALTRALATGATRANVQATVLERWFQGADHPVPAAFGEGLYLKALIARIEARSPTVAAREAARTSQSAVKPLRLGRRSAPPPRHPLRSRRHAALARRPHARRVRRACGACTTRASPSWPSRGGRAGGARSSRGSGRSTAA